MSIMQAVSAHNLWSGKNGTKPFTLSIGEKISKTTTDILIQFFIFVERYAMFYDATMKIILKISFFIIMIAIALLSLLPEDRMGKEISDSLKHLGAYLLLGFMGTLAFAYNVKPRETGIVLMICVLFGGLVEILQQYTGRHPELRDLFADAVGALIGIGIGFGINRYRKSHRRSS